MLACMCGFVNIKCFMYIVIKGPFQENSHVLMQRAGYAGHRAPGEVSYTKRLGGVQYPRFHVYPEMKGEDIRLNLHLDMKKHSYEGFSRHQGEYDGKKVEGEIERLRVHFESFKGVPEVEDEKPKKKFFGLF